jgi:hypothetical protein
MSSTHRHPHRLSPRVAAPLRSLPPRATDVGVVPPPCLLAPHVATHHYCPRSRHPIVILSASSPHPVTSFPCDRPWCRPRHVPPSLALPAPPSLSPRHRRPLPARLHGDKETNEVFTKISLSHGHVPSLLLVRSPRPGRVAASCPNPCSSNKHLM